MTREEAAKILDPETSRDAFCKYVGEHSFMEACEACNEACRIAAAALRAQQTPLDRSRWEGCEYCAHQKDNIELCLMLSHDESDCDRGMYIHDGCLISNSGEFQYVKIRFCPMCGRPLTEEAWAELERRLE